MSFPILALGELITIWRSSEKAITQCDLTVSSMMEQLIAGVCIFFILQFEAAESLENRNQAGFERINKFLSDLSSNSSTDEFFIIAQLIETPEHSS